MASGWEYDRPGFKIGRLKATFDAMFKKKTNNSQPKSGKKAF